METNGFKQTFTHEKSSPWLETHVEGHHSNHQKFHATHEQSAKVKETFLVNSTSCENEKLWKHVTGKDAVPYARMHKRRKRQVHIINSDALGKDAIQPSRTRTDLRKVSRPNDRKSREPLPKLFQPPVLKRGDLEKAALRIEAEVLLQRQSCPRRTQPRAKESTKLSSGALRPQTTDDIVELTAQLQSACR